MTVPTAGETLSTPQSSSRIKSGVRAVLEFSRIPPSWLNKRPRLPSRNWLIFLGFTASLTGLYTYDRRECKRIQREYVDRVKHLAEQPAGPMEWPRKVVVYGSKWPGDEDYDRSMKYFRKYVKPILVAAAVDYEMINGKRHGELAVRIAEKIKSERRLAVGLDQQQQYAMPLPTHRTPEEIRQDELKGGIVVVGRQTFKELMAGLKRGWTDPLDRIDREELLARELQDDVTFDEPEEEAEENVSAQEKHISPIYSPLRDMHSLAMHSHMREPSSVPPFLNVPPATIPQQPPILLVPFTNYIGFSQIPLMLWEFFNRRYRAQDGAEAAYRLVTKHTRPFVGPSSIPSTALSDVEASSPATSSTQGGDLDFDRKSEQYYKNSLSTTVADIEKARTKFYKELPARIQLARDLERRIREPTKDEVRHPPPTEVELRAERMRKELRWRNDLEGWGIMGPGSQVIWDERFRDALSVYVDPYPGGEQSP